MVVSLSIEIEIDFFFEADNFVSRLKHEWYDKNFIYIFQRVALKYSDSIPNSISSQLRVRMTGAK